MRDIQTSGPSKKRDAALRPFAASHLVRSVIAKRKIVITACDVAMISGDAYADIARPFGSGRALFSQ
ncbi:MAG: hypothetical protein A3C79_01520 [Candidatus Taylorbacteria bacterium RIFCSPHIGHO2_02_FULL_45_28]|uniref:Uncharacterized protein n=1 Tax=Candidatus Taylorbacteria bacterium RIFCSPHIGHO2_12_FULL_45_16 TaxID=1802315 RepID=A0A1G2MYU4_9BACT|nr:MAG: hypothetical protein A2830_03685 [Candidatus Taylorbacteria bacterium RIFCSPHIGHO2_01_FULL_44_110]OHA25117.1 MAG: hypothetical protein A3C79_01520 [Candidatus Taylorbacteria bacterium RIFCSPHIGHO2_02_FULL_45_28]OHA28998.1 MAG: hypothetical protein A3F51_01905 [Candidatus Taylorbacteria bacterium RIFCSPHIGHO2_12_FULL_45_16]OHA33116.1 MAG: hypothetical protein A3A23_03585 [Candidatus Taylorbacteria bacterium RIFCSPLOWO2_01_FULL_45_59]OHA39396.1 MAG: hypothetical protein A3I98_02345 [Candi